MKHWLAGALALVWVQGVAFLGDAEGKKKTLNDAQIRVILIDESIAAYSGNCPCPYSRASNGSRCGRRSAHSRAGGEAPLCFPQDVSKEMVQEYRDTHPDE
jgi:hypothetical protein